MELYFRLKLTIGEYFPEGKSTPKVCDSESRKSTVLDMRANDSGYNVSQFQFKENFRKAHSPSSSVQREGFIVGCQKEEASA
ncbi:hypothetical protein TNCV_542881 [Trichonephila clavipes]|nr:hypothetical protein TNCV_542881 [Trichonephila clavipes]